MKITFFVVSILAASVALASAQTPEPKVVPQLTDEGVPRRSTYLLGPDDQIVIQALNVPEISEKPQRVDPTGDIKLPVVGRLHAAGKTVDELELELVKRLKEFIREPDVTVTVAEYHSQTVSVIGAVRSPGIQQLQGRTTIVQLLSKVGGVDDSAGPIVRILRRPEWDRIPLPEAIIDETTKVSVVDIELAGLLNSTTPEKNIVVLPNDTISIPKADIVYVIGEVNKVGAVQVAKGGRVSIMEAISAAGGVLRTAAPTKARVLRLDASGQRRNEVPVDLQRIMQGKANDTGLVSGDILVVPDSTGKRVGNRALELLISSGIMIGTYGLIR